MVPNPAIRNLIREDKIHQIYSQMQIGQTKFGMQTMNQSPGRRCANAPSITLEEAIGRTSDPDELQQHAHLRRGRRARRGRGRPGTPAASTARERSPRLATESREENHGPGRRQMPRRQSRPAGEGDGLEVGGQDAPGRGAHRRRWRRATRRRCSQRLAQMGIEPVAGEAEAARDPASACPASDGVTHQGPPRLHPPVRDDDRRRPAARAVPRHPRHRRPTTRPSARCSWTVKARVEPGSTFADALAEHPKVFDELFVHLVARRRGRRHPRHDPATASAPTSRRTRS